MSKPFYFSRLDTNSHGTQGKGQPWNKEMRRGPKFVVVTLEGFDRESRLRKNIGKRLIFYWPSGAWWHFDVMYPAWWARPDHQG